MPKANPTKSAISTFDLFERFPDKEAARKYFEGRLWPNGPVCPVCGLGERITTRKDGYYRCNQCEEDFTVRTGTIMERSHIPLHKWLYAMYLLVTARKGISSLQLAKEIGITQKSAWFLLHRLREACGKRVFLFAPDAPSRRSVGRCQDQLAIRPKDRATIRLTCRPTATPKARACAPAAITRAITPIPARACLRGNAVAPGPGDTEVLVCGISEPAVITTHVCGGKQARVCRVTGKEHDMSAVVRSKDGGSVACKDCGVTAMSLDLMELP